MQMYKIYNFLDIVIENDDNGNYPFIDFILEVKKLCFVLN